MKNDFDSMQGYVDEMQATSKTREKEVILKHYKEVPFVRECVYYTLNPEYMYGVTSKQCEKYAGKQGLRDTGARFKTIPPYKHLFELLDDLRNRVVTGHAAILHVLDFTMRHAEYKQLIYGIIDKDIETRANATLVNKVWGKGFIPAFKVALAAIWEPEQVDYSEGWFASRKMNGLRCICKVDKLGNPRFFTRTGKEFFTLGVLADCIRKARVSDIVYDGEVCIMDGSVEDFKAMQKQYNKKNSTIANPKYMIFDILTHAEFSNGLSARILTDRLYDLQAHSLDRNHFELLTQSMVKSDKGVAEALDLADSKGWEGLILRKNVGYKGKRSKDIYKCKKFKDAEYVVTAIESGKMRFIEDGKDISRTCLTKAIIMHKGHPVGVGSGWSKDDREFYYLNQDKLIGKTITVKYKQESEDSTGKKSLEFPIFLAVHGQEREA